MPRSVEVVLAVHANNATSVLFEGPDTNTHITRSRTKQELKIPRTRLIMADKNIRIRGSKIWNLIETQIKTIDTYDNFKF